MLFVASPDYSQLRTNYLKAKEAYALAQKSYARAKDLYEHKAIAEQVLEQAQAAESQAGGDLVAAQAALKVLGISDPDTLVQSPPSFEVPVKSPINGEVVEQNVAAGQLVQPGVTQCFIISDTSTVWVLVNVYQKDLPYVKVGDPVTIQTDAYQQLFHGRIAYVAASLDPNTRTLQARIETGNPGEKLKPEMFASIHVDLGNHKAIVVPSTAVIHEGQATVVYVEVNGKPEQRNVTTGRAVDGKVEITAGVEAGEQVAVNGAELLTGGASQP